MADAISAIAAEIAKVNNKLACLDHISKHNRTLWLLSQNMLLDLKQQKAALVQKEVSIQQRAGDTLLWSLLWSAMNCRSYPDDRPVTLSLANYAVNSAVNFYIEPPYLDDMVQSASATEGRVMYLLGP
eukprot:jgi/Chrzof1/12687/Cz07g04020.t1